jgi:hypothetical protein
MHPLGKYSGTEKVAQGISQLAQETFLTLGDDFFT